MATTYTLGTYDSSVLPGGLHRDAVQLCQGAVAFGWKVVVKGLVVRLVAPADAKVITISASNRNIPYQQHKKTIAKFGNPIITGALETDEQLMAHAERVTMAEEQAPAVRAKQAEVSQRETKTAMAAALEQAEVKPEQFVDASRTLLREAPMLAHRGQGTAYMSPTTNQRDWSDGTVDYACRSEGCDFTSESRMGIGPHWRSHVTRGEEQPAGKPGEVYVVPPHEPAYEKTGYTPRRDRVSALAQVIAALDLSAMSAEELAEFVLDWQHTQSEQGTRHAAEREDLTSDDILNRIRTMLDNGTYLRQQEEIEQLRNDRDSLSLAVEEAEARANDAKERWDTLRSLMEDA